MSSEGVVKLIIKRLPEQPICIYRSSDSTASLVVKRLPNQTIFFLYVVIRYGKIDWETSSKSNYILPIGRQTVLQN